MNDSVPHRLLDAPPSFEPILLDARAPVVTICNQLTPRKRRHPFKEITRGSVTVKIYGREGGPFTITWRENAQGKRQATMRAEQASAESFADEKATQLANGETWRREMGHADYAEFLRARERAQTVNTSVLLLVEEALEARKKNSGTNIVHKCCPEIVAELLTRPRRKPRGQKWQHHLTRMLESFGRFFAGPFHLVRAKDINDWLDTIPGGLDYRFHHRAAVAQLARYAIAHNYAPRDWNEIKSVEDEGRAKVTIRIWSPEQLRALLEHTRPPMIPFTTCMAFAMVRHEELHPEQFAVANKIPLDWSDFDWEKRELLIREETGKTGERLVPLPENLLQWLAPYREDHGPVCTVKNTSNALSRAKHRAGLPAGKNQSRNVLRKSAISYRIGQTNNRGQVAEEAGTSLAKIKTNYRRAATAAQSQLWFKLEPRPEQLPLGNILAKSVRDLS